ncbi:amidohydrolase [Erythrobacteraceae bacterium CFH 75059]|uniref:amidohydrolase n=1 Tax=Qipengyuania thermophila TaxID=2509361 RepID=UPI00101F9378|nr:amidohydrolase [Qipengyuania thermophila]TCD06899.1 amidohydrolase [Erythrobacteraceae bacterium CFH 75059]
MLALVGAAVLLLAQPARADTRIENVNGLTVAADGSIQRFVAILIGTDGKVKATYRRGERLPRLRGTRIDGGGRTMIPGMIDSHVHVMGIGFGALTLDLSSTSSLEEALQAIRTFAAENPDRPWILGRGWNQERWKLGRFPTAADLDSVVSDRPVWLERVDGHAGWANSVAMRVAGVDARAADPAGGRIERTASGAPSGVFVDSAADLVGRAVPQPRAVERDAALREAQELLHAFGITAVADMGTTLEDWQAFRRAGDAGWLTLRIMAYAAGVEAMDQIAGPGPTPWLYWDRLRLNGVKLYLDGALGSRGAWLKQPYADDPANRGLRLLDDTRLRNLMSRAAMGQFQVAVHAIGDAADAEILAAVHELAGTYTGDRRWRVEHAQVIDPADLSLFGAHGIIASMQPVHQTSDRLMAEARLGPARLRGAYAWRSVAENGARLAFGSDAPVESPAPFAGFAAAISRVDAAGQPAGGWMPEEAVTPAQAFAAFTAGGAYAGFAEGRFGRLVPGEWADFILIDRDPLTTPAARLREAVVHETWVAGYPVYRRGS